MSPVHYLAHRFLRRLCCPMAVVNLEPLLYINKLGGGGLIRPVKIVTPSTKKNEHLSMYSRC